LGGLASDGVDGDIEPLSELVSYLIFLETKYGGTTSAWRVEALVYSSRSSSDEFFGLFPSRLLDSMSDSVTIVSSKTAHVFGYCFQPLNYNFADDLFLYKGN